MNRRNFFKVVTGFVAGIFATSVKSEPQSLYKCDPNSANIDPNSDWAKQKPLTLDMLMKAKEEIDNKRRTDYAHILTFDEPIVSFCEWHGRLFVACSHSVWEIFEDYEGQICRKVIIV